MTMRDCDVCAVVRRYYPKDPQLHRMHCPACVHCGARLIQKHQRQQGLTPAQRQDRSRAALSDWMACGHAEAQLRSLAKATAWAVAPADAGQG